MNKRPNIILYLVDDLGYGDVSCLNENSKIQTENIDRLARDGISFTDAHSCSAVCSPSRYGILTGRYNWRSRLKSGVLPGIAPPLIEEDRVTLGSMLKSQGYRTAAVGKWHLGMDWPTKDGWQLPETSTDLINDLTNIDFEAPIKNGPLTRGFDYFYGMTGSLDQPPFVMIENDRCTQIPDHWEGTPGFSPFYPGDFLPEHKDFGPCVPDFDLQQVVPMAHDKVLELVEEYAGGDEPFFIYSPTPAVHGPLVPADEFVGKSGIGLYGDFVLQVDDFIGKLEAKLEDLEIADNTIVIFTSDNGCSPIVDIPKLHKEMGHNPSYVFRGTKFDIWEGGHRVPLIVKWPETIKAGQSSDRYVCLTDLFSTISQIVGCGCGDDAGEDSFSNLPLWMGEDKSVREAVVHHSGKGMYSIRKGNWKLELCAGSGGTSFPSEGRDDLSALAPIQLYDLSRDIGEQENLYAQYPEVVKELRDLLASYVISGRSTPGATRPNHHHPTVWPGLAWMNL